MFVVFDLDGTLCDISHRLHLIKRERPDWDAFFKACIHDQPRQPIIDTLLTFLAVPGLHRVEIWSGRSEDVRDETTTWLRRNRIDTNSTLVRMRPSGDYRSDVDLKKSWLEEAEGKPDLVFDDRQKMVEMWRELGIVCCQVAAWEE